MADCFILTEASTVSEVGFRLSLLLESERFLQSESIAFCFERFILLEAFFTFPEMLFFGRCASGAGGGCIIVSMKSEIK